MPYDSNDIEEHLEETAAEAEPEPEPEPEQEPEPEVHEEKSEPVLEESAPEETVEKSPSPAPADPAPAVQEDSRVMTVDGSFLSCGSFITVCLTLLFYRARSSLWQEEKYLELEVFKCSIIPCPNYSSHDQLPPSYLFLYNNR